MNTWNYVPLFRLLPFFICGIYLGFDYPADWLEFVVVFPVLMTTLWLGLRRRQQYSRRWLFGLLSCLLLLETGRLVSSLQDTRQRSGYFARQCADGYMAMVSSPPELKPRSVKIFLQVQSVRCKGKWVKADGMILAYFQKSKESLKLHYGDVVAFRKVAEPVKPPSNPGQFDYRQYLRYQEVYSQVFLPDSSWILAGKGQGNMLMAMAGSLRSRLLDIFSQYGLSGQEYAVLAALLLGYEDAIDQDLFTAYAATGALHVLSVSGLHVGIIYLALNAALFFLDRRRKLRWIKCMIVLAFLWGYALLTGLSPSVLRSSAMLSFVVAGSSLSRRTNMLNTLAASAFLLLALDPGLLMQAGFQLSYLAVLGIVIVYPVINKLVYSRYKLVRSCWSLVAVSLAAQLATFPLGLYYFHQFPNYFLPANLVIIPLSSLIIYGGIALFLVSPFPVLASSCGIGLSWLVETLNDIVSIIQSLPYALADGIVLSKLELFLVFVMVAAFSVMLHSRQRAGVLVLLAAICCFMGCRIQRITASNHLKQMVVYGFPRQSIIDFTNGRKGYTHCHKGSYDSTFAEIKNYWWQTGSRQHMQMQPNRMFTSTNLVMKRSWIRFYDRTILFVDSSFVMPGNAIFAPVDFLVVAASADIRMDSLLKRLPAKLVILDGSHNLRQAAKRRAEIIKCNTQCYSVPESGAYVYTLREQVTN